MIAGRLGMRSTGSGDLRTGSVRGSFIWTLIAMVSALVWVPSARAATYPANTTYYISNNNCSNGSPGTSSANPWCDFTNVNGQTFSPGDKILLASGSTFTSGMTPFGSGTSTAPITIGCYDAGNSCATNYPTIKAGTTISSIYLADPSYWTVTNLSMTNSNGGVHVNFNTLGHQGLVFQNLYMYDLAGNVSSILLDGFNSNPPTAIPSNNYIVNGVTLNNIGVVRSLAPSFSAGYANAQEINNGYANAQQNILVKNLTMTDYMNCLGVVDVQNFTLLNGLFTNGDTNGGCGAGVYMTTVSNANFNNSVYKGKKFTNTNDNGVYVFDNQESGVRWRGSYFYNNAGAGIEGAENPSFAQNTASTNSNFQVSNSAFLNNSTADTCSVASNPTATQGYVGDVQVSYSPQTVMDVSNNLYSDTAQTCNGFVVGQTFYQTLANNYNFGGSTLYNSADQFSGTQGQSQWSYRHWNGSSWFVDNPTYNAASGWTFPSGSTVNQFDITPDTCTNCWTARFWQAPKTGTVHIAGWVLKSTTGTPVVVGINHNSTWVWGNGSGSWYSLGANDQVGVGTSATVDVTQGDYLVFCVSNPNGADVSGAAVSWAPSITY